MASPWRRLSEAVGERTGLTLERREHVELLEASNLERRALQRELDLLAYSALDYFGGQEQDLKAVARRKLVQQSRVAWQQDPQAGAAVDLLNDFVFGRGVPKPKCRDPKVQEIVDEAWDDPDNQLVLTAYSSQLALGTDLALQSNLFLLVFDDGGDGKVKLGLLNHDSVENVVRDPENRLRVLWYAARERKYKWDFDNDQPVASLVGGPEGEPRVIYFGHWKHADEAPDDHIPPPDRQGEGRVFHIAVNKGSESAFGHPVMQRTLRWFTAYNNFMEARVDIARAAAAFVMKRKIKGSKNQVSKMAQKALSRRSELAAQMPEDGDPLLAGPKAASILNENEEVSHEDFGLNSNAGNALTDGQMIRSQISAATGWPQHYLGDVGSTTLATATSMELPVLKHVEGRQEVFEQLFRFFVDRVIERAVESGRLDPLLSPEELAQKAEEEAPPEAQPGPLAAAAPAAMNGAPPGAVPPATTDLAAAGEQEAPGEPGFALDEDEADTERDLSYELSMPSPLRRMLQDLTGAVTSIAQTFDPNGTNMELSKILLGIVLGEGLELEDPQEAVERVFPPGYEDPAMAMMAQQMQPGAPPNPNDPAGAPQGENNPYGAPMRASDPEANPYGVTESRVVATDRRGNQIVREARFQDLPPQAQAAGLDRADAEERRFEDEVIGEAESQLEKLLKEEALDA